MSRVAYYRVSTTDQSIDSQRLALGGGFDKEFADEGVSGAIPAGQRPGAAYRGGHGHGGAGRERAGATD